MIKLTEETQGLVLNGDCLQVLKELEDNSVDSLVSDPPYHLVSIVKRFGKEGSAPAQEGKDGSFARLSGGFMGKTWDGVNEDGIGIAQNPELWKECLRVLKPGAYLLAFGGTRTYHRMACAIEDAGFEIRDMIEWTYGSGFPKSLNIGKAIDKINGETGRLLKFVQWYRTTGMKQKETNEIIGKTDVGSHYLRLDQPAIPTRELWAILRPHIKAEIPKWVDELVERIEREREIIGKDKNWGKKSEAATFTGGQEWKITKGTSEWEGYGTALKPAHEPIVMARKPLAEKTVAENVLKYGTGGINIDESRVGVDNNDPNHREISNKTTLGTTFGSKEEIKSVSTGKSQLGELGRFPANLIHDGSEEVLKEFEKAGNCGGDTRTSKSTYDKGIWGNAKPIVSNALYNDSGTPARFFKQCEFTEQDFLYTERYIKRKELDILCYENLDVKDVERKLLTMNQIENKMFSVQRNVLPFIISQNQNLNALFVEKNVENIEINSAQNLVQILTDGIMDFMETGQPFLSIYGLTPVQLQSIIILTQNLAYSVGKKEKLDIMRIIQNLKILFGCVEVATINTIEQGRSLIYQAKASKSERDKGCEHFPISRPDTRTSTGMGTFEEKGVLPGHNNHPTVKPLKLMEYLIKMVTPKGGVVLDPFAGSGTTLVASKKLGYKYIGIELTKEYIPIIEARLEAVK